VAGLFKELRGLNKKTFRNYLEIYIKTNTNNVLKLGKKRFYKSIDKKNIIGVDTQPEYPTNLDTILHNSFEKNIKNYLIY
jgi:hypothetical protein